MHPMQRSSRCKDGRSPDPRAPLPEPEPPAEPGFWPRLDRPTQPAVPPPASQVPGKCPASAEQLTLANVQAKLAQMGGRPLGFSPDTIYDPDLVHLPTRLATVLAAAGPPLDATARHVLLAMFVSPTMHGVYDPAPRGAGAALAELTGHSARSCWEALRMLEELGYVHVQRRGRGPHRYWLGVGVLGD